MSNYDDAITLESAVQQIGGWLNQDGLRRALRNIDARLSALEAANKKDLTAHLYPNGLGVPVNIDPFRIPSTNAPPPPDTHKLVSNPEQREPGWYWVKWEEGDWSVAKLRLSPPGSAVPGFEEQWWKGAHWTALSPVLIGPRIQEPGQ